MAQFKIRRGRRGDSGRFVDLLVALADFEKLNRPTPEGKKRIVHDIFGRKLVNLFVAELDGKLIGYALYFYTYSSFLARPTLYLEDLFVHEKYRKSGVGLALFNRCVREAVQKGCGRMEWAVLTWNSKAIYFYERLGAKRQSEWYVYRLNEAALAGLSRKKA